MDGNRLGTLLLEGGIVGEVELERCLAIQSLTGGNRPLGQILVDQGLVDASTLQRLLELQQGRGELRAAEVAPADRRSRGLLAAACANRASEIVVSEGRPVRLRVAGEWRELPGGELRGPEVWDFVREAMGGEVLEELADRHFVVRSFRDQEAGSGTATAFRQFDGVAVRVTFAPDAAAAAADPVPPQLAEIVRGGAGLVLVVLERGVGRFAALAPLLPLAAADPARYTVVVADEPLPTASLPGFTVRRRYGLVPEDRAAALRCALREDPDALFVADAGDAQTFDLALRAAEGGRLVVACIDAANTVAALQRILDFQPTYAVARARASLCAVLQAVLVRRELPAAERTGTVVATELLLVDDAVRETLRAGDLGDLTVLMRLGDGRRGWSMDESLLDLLAAGRVRAEDVFARTEAKTWLLDRARGQQAAGR